MDMGGGAEDGEPESLVSSGHSDANEMALQLCKYCEMFLCDEIVASCVGMDWDMPQFKSFNAINSIKQGTTITITITITTINIIIITIITTIIDIVVLIR